MKVKILHILHKVDIGGTERAVLNYIREQQNEDIINDACSLYKGKLSKDYKEHSNKYIEINKSNIFKRYNALRKKIKESNYDIVYAYGLRTNILLRFMPKKFKLIYGVRGLENSSNKIADISNKLTLKRNDLIITNSELSRKYILRKYDMKDDRVITIHNGTYLPSKVKKLKYENKLNLIIIANLNKVKGFDYLLPAIKQLKKQCINVNLKILGEGTERENIETYIENNDLNENIQLHGQVEDVYSFLKKSHILISSSLSEGLSNSIMEGMAFGLPVIATDVGGSSELVIPNESGVLIESKNIDNLVSAVKRYYEAPNLIKEHGLYGREIIREKFSFENLVNKNNEVFSSLKGVKNEKDNI